MKNDSVFLVLNTILKEQQHLQQKISPENYTLPITSLDGSTVGGHTRHIIEFLEVLLLIQV